MEYTNTATQMQMKAMKRPVPNGSLNNSTASDMADYLKSYNMPFGAVDFAKTRDVKSAWAGGGIPNLVWLGSDDKVIKGSYETDGIYSPKIRGSYVGPQSVLAAFKKR